MSNGIAVATLESPPVIGGGRHSTQRAVLGVATVAASLVVLDASVVNVAFPAIRDDFPGASTGSLSWVVTAYALVFGALLLPAGRLADRLGLARAFRLGLLIFTVGSALAGVAPTLAALVAGRAVQGIGAAILGPATMGLVVAVTQPAERVRAVARMGGITALAFAMGPTVGGILVSSLNWRCAFFVNLPLTFAALLLGRRMVPRAPIRRDEKSDLVGLGLLIVCLASAALALSNGGEWGWLSLPTIAAGATAMGCIPLVALRSARRPHALLPLDLMRNHRTRLANFATFTYSAGFFAALLLDVIYLTTVRGWTAFEAGLTITPAPVLVALLAPHSPKIAARLGDRGSLAVGSSLVAISMLTFSIAISVDELAIPWLLATAVWGIGIALTFPLLTAAALHGIPVHRAATGSALNQTFRQFGGVLGVAVLAAILQSVDETAAFRDGWLLCAAAATGTCLLGLALKSSRSNPHQLTRPA